MVATPRRRLAVGLLLLTATVLAPAKAHAGVIAWGNPTCTEPIAVSQLFGSMFSAYDKCESLCKLAANRCRTAVSDAASCQKKSRTDLGKVLELAFCGPLSGAEKRDCQNAQRAELKIAKEALAADRALALANCGVYQSQCLVDCATF